MVSELSVTLLFPALGEVVLNEEATECVPPKIVNCGARSPPAVPPLSHRKVPSIQSVAVGVVLAVPAVSPESVCESDEFAFFSKIQFVHFAVPASVMRLPRPSKK